MPRRAQTTDSGADTPSATDLPTCSGAQLELAQWLRELLIHTHLFEAELAYFLSTASAITTAGKTAVCSLEHAVLL